MINIKFPISRKIKRENEKNKIIFDRWIFAFTLLWSERILWIFPAFSVGFMSQIKFDLESWREVGSYYSFNLTNYWSWGRSHAYYDGPHDAFSIGPIHFSWSSGNCNKCFKEF